MENKVLHRKEIMLTEHAATIHRIIDLYLNQLMDPETIRKSNPTQLVGTISALTGELSGEDAASRRQEQQHKELIEAIKSRAQSAKADCAVLPAVPVTQQHRELIDAIKNRAQSAEADHAVLPAPPVTQELVDAIKSRAQSAEADCAVLPAQPVTQQQHCEGSEIP